MQRIILDTNVIVSALISKSYPSKILENILFKDGLRLCLSEEIFSEYAEVLSRSKFSKYPGFKENALLILNYINEVAEFHKPKLTKLRTTDPDDLKFIELALSCKAHFLITGNIKHFPDLISIKTQIVTPYSYWTLWKL